MEQTAPNHDDSLEALADRMTFARFMEEAEARYIAHMLGKHGGNQRQAAEAAGLTVQSLHRRKQKHGLEVVMTAEVRRVGPGA